MKINNMSFAKLVFFAAFIFLVVILLIEFLFSLNSCESTTQLFSKITSTDYLIKKGIGSLLYGVIMALLMKRKFRKQNK